MIQNTEEDYHAKIERSVLPVLAQLRTGETSILEDEKKYINFSYFIASQIFRTKAIRAAMTAITLPDPSIDFNRCWKILAHVYSATVGSTIFSNRKKNPVHLLKSDGINSFITCDQPIYNFHSSVGLGESNFSLYYPISPMYAVFIDDESSPLYLNEIELDAKQVCKLNDFIAKNAHSQIFSDNPELLKPYMK